MIQRLHNIIFLALSLSWVLPGQAAEIYRPEGQFHGRSGMLMGNISGPITTTFSVVPTMEIEYERFWDRRKSYLMYGVIAMDQASAKTQYAYAGYGQRFYFGNTRAYPVISSDKRFQVAIKPTWRFYYNWDVGFSSVLVQQVTDTLDAVSTLFDFGGGVGTTYQLSERFSLEANGRMSYGYGFSSVAVNAILIKMSFGATYFF